jgi:hypothetical protein
MQASGKRLDLANEGPPAQQYPLESHYPRQDRTLKNMDVAKASSYLIVHSILRLGILGAPR